MLFEIVFGQQLKKIINHLKLKIMALLCNRLDFPKRKSFFNKDEYYLNFIPYLSKKNIMLKPLCALRMLKTLIDLDIFQNYCITFKLYKTKDTDNYRFFYYHFYITDDLDFTKKILFNFVETYSK